MGGRDWGHRTKGRIGAFSDGVLAIIITIMVLELKVPHGVDWASLTPLWPVFLSHVLSFVNVGIYWNNHDHMFHAVRHVGGWVLWANLHLLFWLSLLPFTTGFMGAVAYTLLIFARVGQHGRQSDFARALKSGRKEQVSTASYRRLAAGIFRARRAALNQIAPARAIR